MDKLPIQANRVIGKDNLEVQHSYLDGVEVVPMLDGSFFLFPLYRIGAYEEGKVPKAHCSGYAKRVAREKFGKHYVSGEGRGEAWNLRYFHHTVRLGNGDLLKQIEDGFDTGVIQPGDLMAIWNPYSCLNAIQRDRQGERILNSHVETVVGRDIFGDLRLGGQVIQERRTIVVRELLRQGYKPLLIIKPGLKAKQKSAG